MRTVGQQGGRTFPTGAGIGATQDACAVMSPARAAGMLPTRTVTDAFEISPGPAGMQVASMHGVVVSVDRAPGAPPISTVGCPLMIVNGMGGCGTGVGVGAGGWIGA